MAKNTTKSAGEHRKLTYKIKNQSKRVHNIRRHKTANDRKVDLNDKYNVGSEGTWHCPKCGTDMSPFKQDEYGDIVVSCNNQACRNSKDFIGGAMNTKLAKLTKEMQLHSRYYKGQSYNRLREYQYRPKFIQI